MVQISWLLILSAEQYHIILILTAQVLMFNMLLNFKKQKMLILNFSHKNHNLYNTFMKYQNDLLPSSTATSAMASTHSCSSNWYCYFSEAPNYFDKGNNFPKWTFSFPVSKIVPITYMSPFGHFIYQVFATRTFNS